MSYFVTVSFDIKNAASEDYDAIYSALRGMGLERSLTDDSGQPANLPSTTVAGTVQGYQAATVRDRISSEAKSAYRRHGLRGKIYVAVGGDWAWSCADAP